jgi:PAS domain S-box-containing protein
VRGEPAPAPHLAGLLADAYRLLFEDNPEPMWLFDAETFAFLIVNDAAVRKYGYSREEFLVPTMATRPVFGHAGGRMTAPKAGRRLRVLIAQTFRVARSRRPT